MKIFIFFEINLCALLQSVKCCNCNSNISISVYLIVKLNERLENETDSNDVIMLEWSACCNCYALR